MEDKKDKSPEASEASSSIRISSSLKGKSLMELMEDENGKSPKSLRDKVNESSEASEASSSVRISYTKPVGPVNEATSAE